MGPAPLNTGQAAKLYVDSKPWWSNRHLSHTSWWASSVVLMLTDQRDSLVVFCLKSNHFLAFVDNFSGSYDSLNSKGFGLPPILSDMTGGERAIDTECKKQISEWKATLADKTEVRLETEPT